ncbi:MAG: sulfite oxidase, partial [Nocardioidaceae bacterium]|nr:sulfite oxidase [Nocardioidaceae bacterium]
LHGSDPYNAEPPRHALAGHHLTAIDTFYSRNHGPVPTIDTATWRLRADGLVQRPLELGLEDLKKQYEHQTTTATLQCAGNRRADLDLVRDIPGEDLWGPCATSTATWTGTRLADVLRSAGLDDEARHIHFGAQDVTTLAHPPQAYGSSIPVGKATSDEVLLAWQMNGQDLPAVHGGPVRVLIPGYIGARSVKWLDRVTASLQPSESFFQTTAYRLLPVEGTPGPGVGVSLGPVALNSAILVPDDGATLSAGDTDVRGYAYAGERGITRVDVSLDQGRTWVQAQLDEQAERWTWCLWRTRLPLQEGEATISVRAWDTSAATQPASAQQVWNPKGYANSSWAQATVTVSA